MCLFLDETIYWVCMYRYIIYSWSTTGLEQLDLIVGRTADPAFLDVVRSACMLHTWRAPLGRCHM